jgi:Uma2 family endonuclease
VSTQLNRRYTLEEYFLLDASSDEKFEYFEGEVFAMSGASLAHEKIVANIIVSLRNSLRGRPCHVLPSNVRVRVPSLPPYRYPDVTALCGSIQIESIEGLDVLVNPALIVEVLSPATEACDRGDKFTHYKSIPAFSEYLLIAQHRPHATHYVKQPDGEWSYGEVNDAATLQISALECFLPLRDIYENVRFSAAPPLPHEIGENRS